MIEDKIGKEIQRSQVYGRRVGRKLGVGKTLALDNLLPTLMVHLDDAHDPQALFPSSVRDIHLEIGFGAGEHLLAQAKAHPTIGFIGCEPYMTGVAHLTHHIHGAGLDNIRLFPDDARSLLNVLPHESLAQVYIFFPDPWPKMRHHKRRIVSLDTLNRLHQLIVPGGYVRLATDHPGYAQWIRDHFGQHAGFQQTLYTRDHPPTWPMTRYEEKALSKGLYCHYFVYQKK